MRRLKLMVLAVGAAMIMLVGLAGPAGAGGKVGIDPGRRNSTDGLAIAIQKVREATPPVAAPLEQVSMNLAMAQDPNQPGVMPPGGGVEP